MPTKNRRRNFAGLQSPQCVQHGDQAAATRTEIEAEESEILRNARAKRKRGEITDEDLQTVYYMVASARVERELTWEQR